MAKGISEALLLTFEGVGLSVPSIYFFSFFRNRVMSISVTTMTRADEFLRHFAQAARGKPAGRAGPARPRRRPRLTSQTQRRKEVIELMADSVGGEVKAEPNLTPILDMVFQLITFFMLVINFKSAELDLTLNLPVVGSARPVVDHGGRSPAGAERQERRRQAGGELLRPSLDPAPNEASKLTLPARPTPAC